MIKGELIMERNLQDQTIESKNNILKKFSRKKHLLFLITGILLFIFFRRTVLELLGAILIILLMIICIGYIFIKAGKYIISFSLFIIRLFLKFWAIFLAIGIVIFLFS